MTRRDTDHLSTDIVIVGAGPVGMALGATVARYGMNVLIVESSAGTTPFSKAIGVHAITLERMHTLGLTESLLADGFPMRGYRIYENGRCTMAASFRGVATPYDFVLGLPQSRTEAHLARDLAAQGVTILWQHRMTAIHDFGALEVGGPSAVIEVQRPDGTPMRIEARYVIGADGGRSAVRQAAQIGFPGGSYGNAFLLGDVELDWQGARHDLQFHLSREGYLLLIPMPGGMHRVIAQTDLRWEDFQHRDSRPDARLEMLQQIVDARGPGGIRAHSPRWLTAAPFYYRLAEAAHRDRVFLAGDALHLVSPLGAQGLNLGIGDAFNLGWKLGFVHQGRADMSLLRSYGAERLPVASAVIGTTSRTTRYVTATRWWERMARQVATRWMNDSIRVQRDLPSLLSGIRQRYDPAALTGTPPEGAWPAPGVRMPQARLEGASGSVAAAKLVHGTRFCAVFLLRRLDETTRRAVQAEIGRLHGLDAHLQAIVIAREAGRDIPQIPGAQTYGDPFADLTGDIGAAHAATILVRPDGVVAASSVGLDAGLVRRFFANAPWRKTAHPQEMPDVA